VIDALWPAAMVFGNVRPLIPKPAPETAAPVTTRFAVPVFVSVTFWVLLCPTSTLLKFSDVGAIVSPGCVPVPLSASDRGELEASLTTARVPVKAPGVVGANCS